MLGRRSSLVIAVIVVFLRTAFAQSAEAEMLFDEGVRLMGEQKLAAACEAFDASNRIEARAGTLIRLGDCREKNHQLASAWSAYKDALTIVKDPRKREIATAKVASLEPRLSYLAIMVPDESRIDGLALTRNGSPLDPALWNRAVPVDGGDYVIGGRAPGHDQWTTTVIVPIENGKIDVEVPRFKDLATLLAPPAAQTHEGEPETTQQSADTNARWLTHRRKIAIGIAGGGAVVLVTAIALRVASGSRSDRAFGLCPDSNACADPDAANVLARSSHNFAIGANVSFGLGAAAVVGAGVLWFVSGPSARVVTPIAGPGEAGVALLGTF